MTVYLEDGWFGSDSRTRLRNTVIDGAIDAAGMLLRAGVEPKRLMRIALRIRGFVVLSDPLVRGKRTFGRQDRQQIWYRLERYAEDTPELTAFISDCLDHVRQQSELIALYLHLVHVTRVLQLLTRAMDFTPATGKKSKTSSLSSRSQRKKAAKKSPSRKTAAPSSRKASTKGPSQRTTKKTSRRPRKTAKAKKG